MWAKALRCSRGQPALGTAGPGHTETTPGRGVGVGAGTDSFCHCCDFLVPMPAGEFPGAGACYHPCTGLVTYCTREVNSFLKTPSPFWTLKTIQFQGGISRGPENRSRTGSCGIWAAPLTAWPAGSQARSARRDRPSQRFPNCVTGHPGVPE